MCALPLQLLSSEPCSALGMYMDTNVSVIQFVSAGQEVFPWQYYEVGGDKEKPEGMPLNLPPRKWITRLDPWTRRNFATFGLAFINSSTFS
jgi:hypothetical protein